MLIVQRTLHAVYVRFTDIPFPVVNTQKHPFLVISNVVRFFFLTQKISHTFLSLSHTSSIHTQLMWKYENENLTQN